VDLRRATRKDERPMTDGFSALFWGIITFSLLIVIHEGGHFLMARAFGVKVHEFMIGLPGPAIRLRGKKTTYGITAIPLGGYVRIAGMEPGPEEPLLGPVLATVTRNGTADAFEVATELGIDETQADRLLVTLADWDALEAIEGDEYRYRSKFAADAASDPVSLLDQARSVTYRALSTSKRIGVLSAGVVLNLITAVLVFTVVLSAFGYYQETMRIETLAPDSAAEKAGLQAGDKILSLDGAEVTRWQPLITKIASYDPGTTIVVAIERDGRVVELDATLGENPSTGRAFLGVGPELVFTKPSVPEALRESFSYIGLTFQAILNLLNPVTFQSTVSQSASVIGASYMAAEAARTSALSYASIVALLSLSLGVINIFPIPPLDGGKIAIELFERIRGRQLSRRLSLGLSVSGTLLLFALIGYLMYADVSKYIVN
jgi:regulator of sigma E protease